MEGESLRVAIVIPARLASTRLPNKPLALINNHPMIMHVWKLAIRANLGTVIIAGCDQQVAQCAQEYGANYVHTSSDHSSGTDRVAEAVNSFEQSNNQQFDFVINLQGDMPLFDTAWLSLITKIGMQPNIDISTLVCPLASQSAKDEQVVKVALTEFNEISHRAVYFSRANIPWGEASKWRHIGIYGYKKTSLNNFVQLPINELENSEKLEQLRAIANNMCIAVGKVQSNPISVDTPEDLVNARKIITQ